MDEIVSITHDENMTEICWRGDKIESKILQQEEGSVVIIEERLDNSRFLDDVSITTDIDQLNEYAGEEARVRGRGELRLDVVHVFFVYFPFPRTATPDDAFGVRYADEVTRVRAKYYSRKKEVL